MLLFFAPCLKAQERVSFNKDTTFVSDDFAVFPDSLFVDSFEAMGEKDSVEMTRKEAVSKRNPNRAIIYSAIFPGLGQIYNQKYWKLPLVYGSFIGCMYAITWNGTQYSGYKKAYIDFNDSNDETNSWADYRPYTLPENLVDWSQEQRNWFSSALKSKKDYYRRYRDMSYIISVGVYAIWIIDAFVDAQLFDFDISPDLGMRIDPVIYERTNVSSRSIGLQCSLTF
ncbi:MAG: DUF5683 domain-containing protein [Dysgonamonadaceae bacterium]|jgi:hypothetical protein|nr:DUF5683 domain-containing protein [Dysgonamonadaceae bacterium]